MQFITSDGGPLGDVARCDLDAELGQRLNHEPSISHEFLLGLGRFDGGVRQAQQVN